MPFYSLPTGSSPVLAGDGAPTGGVGNVGDLFLDRTGKALYGPKESGGWPTGFISLAITGPAGPSVTGPSGPASTVPGPTGPQGLSITGPSGPRGDTGPASTVAGPPGPPTSLTVGTVTQGSTPSATLTGPAGAQVLNLVLARGSTGAAGSPGVTGPIAGLAIGTVTDGGSAGASITPDGEGGYLLDLTLPVGATGSTGAASTVTGPTGATGPSVTGPTGEASTVPGPTGPAGESITGPTGAASTVAGPTGPAGQSITGPTGAASTVTGPTGPAGAGGGGSFSWASVPTSSTATGTAGDQAYDADYHYICTATNTWRASALKQWDADPYFSSVALLLAMDGANDGTTFTDLSSAARTVTRNGNAVTKTGTKKYGTASGYFAASGDYLSLADADALELGGGDFAIEMWIKTSSSTQYATLISRSPAAFASGMWSLMINYTGSTSGDLALFVQNVNASTPILTYSGSPSLRDDAWHHVAVSRRGSTWRMYVDGERVGSTTSSATVANIAGGINIARDEHYGRQYVGYIDDLRLTIGSARDYYTEFIATPTSAHPSK